MSAGAVAVAYFCRESIASYLVTRVGQNAYSPTGTSFDDSNSCTLTGKAIEGPFYIPNSVERADISEGREGVPLALRLMIVDAKTCAPMERATVAVWHCDALGKYSGHEDMDPNVFPFTALAGHRAPTTSTSYLRGHQTTDANGITAFQTIFPGWYTPRTPHIHVKVLVEERLLVTTQLFFPQDLIDSVLATAPYKLRGASPYTNGNDIVIGQARGVPGAWPKVSRRSQSIDASLTIGVVRPT